MGNPVVHFDIRTEQPSDLRAFYRDVFGWLFHVDARDDSALASTQSALGIGGGIGRCDEEGSGLTIYVEVPDVDAALASIRTHGGTVVMPRTDCGDVTLARFRDPQGNLIGLVEGVEVGEAEDGSSGP